MCPHGSLKTTKNRPENGNIREHSGTKRDINARKTCDSFIMRYYLDTRKDARDGRFPVKIRLTKDGRTAMALTGVRLSDEDWDPGSGTCKNAATGVRLRDMMWNAEDLILKLRSEGRYASMSAGDIMAEISSRVLSSPVARKEGTLMARLVSYRDAQRKEGTRETYDRAVKTLRLFDRDADSRKLEEITPAYLSRLEAFCLGKGMRVNSVSIIMRNIRTVFNVARREGVTAAYPFGSYKIRQEQTRKRCLSVEDLRRLIRMDLPEDQRRYRDYFMLMFYLIGINSTDLFNARPGDLVNGRLEYRRGKTGKLYSVKVEPEAMAIIERYRGERHLLEPMDTHAVFRDWRCQLNKRLKALGQVTGKRGKVTGAGPFPEISTYWSRHSWATIAYRIGIPVDIIGQALGHSDREHSVTYTYIMPDQGKVDEANRKVIDYTLQNL